MMAKATNVRMVKETQGYRYEDLSDSAKETFRNALAQSNWEWGDWWDSEYDFLRTVLEDEIGGVVIGRDKHSKRDELDITFSMYDRSGDGAWFSADFYVKEFFNGLLKTPEWVPDSAEWRRWGDQMLVKHDWLLGHDGDYYNEGKIGTLVVNVERTHSNWYGNSMDIDSDIEDRMYDLRSAIEDKYMDSQDAEREAFIKGQDEYAEMKRATSFDQAERVYRLSEAIAWKVDKWQEERDAAEAQELAEFDKKCEDAVAELHADILDAAKDFGHMLYKWLEQEVEWWGSDEYAQEHAGANDLWFDEDGKELWGYVPVGEIEDEQDDEEVNNE